MRYRASPDAAALAEIVRRAHCGGTRVRLSCVLVANAVDDMDTLLQRHANSGTDWFPGRAPFAAVENGGAPELVTSARMRNHATVALLNRRERPSRRD